MLRRGRPRRVRARPARRRRDRRPPGRAPQPPRSPPTAPRNRRRLSRWRSSLLIAAPLSPACDLRLSDVTARGTSFCVVAMRHGRPHTPPGRGDEGDADRRVFNDPELDLRAQARRCSLPRLARRRTVTLMSRNGLSLNERYPEVAAALDDAAVHPLRGRRRGGRRSTASSRASRRCAARPAIAA